MQSADDSAAIAVRILQRRERERPVEAAERNEVARLRQYAATLEARLDGIYAEMDLPAAQLRPRGILRRFVRFLLVAGLGAGGVLILQMTTPMGARLTDWLRANRSLGGLAALSHVFGGESHAPVAVPSPPPAPAPVVVPAPEPTPPPVAVQPTPPPPAPPAPAPVVVREPVASPRSESHRRVPTPVTKHAQPRKDVPAVQEAVIPACSDSDPLCGISKRPH